MDSTEPLLGVSVADEPKDDLSEDVAVKRMKDIASDTKPEAVVQYVRDSGLYLLGEFDVTDTASLAPFKDEEYLVEGYDACNIDFESSWRRKLREKAKHDHTPGAKSSLHVSLEAYVVTIRDAADPDDDGIVHTMLTMYQNHTCSMSVFHIPAVQAVINYKWNAFAQRLLMWEFAIYVLWLASFTVFTLTFQSEDEQLPLWDLLRTPRGPITFGALLLSLLFMTPFILIEIATVANYQRGWINVYNAMDITLYTLQIASAALYLARWNLDSQKVSLMMAIQHVLMWFRIQYFSRVFRATRFSFVDSIKAVLVDIRWYLFFMALLWWGFGCAFHVLFREDTAYQGFDTLAHSLVTVFCYSMGGSLPAQMVGRGSGWEALGLAMVFQFLMTMILMKLLIGLMSSSISKANKDADNMWLLGKAEVIDELESSIPKALYPLLGVTYPHFIHILRINKATMSSEEEKLVWSHSAAKYTAKPSAAPVTNAQLAEQLATLQKQMAALAAQLEAASKAEASSSN